MRKPTSSGVWSTPHMPPLRMPFGRLCRSTRTALALSQRQLALAAGLSAGYVAAIETGTANPTLDVVERIGEALGLDLRIVGSPPVLVGPRQRELVHARCSGYADRRLRADGWLTLREVEVVHGRSHGWIDLLAFDPRTGRLVVVEIKTRLDDMGAIERQVGWYRRMAPAIARLEGWSVRHTSAWLLLLASDDVETAVRANKDVLRFTFPARGAALLDATAPGLALIDPTSRRRRWLIRPRIDGRRTAAPYRDAADAARRIAMASGRGARSR
ncbi:MAG: helix-turn-helix domain-containing protein [Chloroflexota bacterium]